MKIKNRLSIQFTLIVVSILLMFSSMVYYFSFSSQQFKFKVTILEKAKNTAILLIDVVEVDSTLLKKIHQTTIPLKKEEILITNSELKPIYSNKVEYLTDPIIKKYNSPDAVINFSILEKDGVCYRHHFKNQMYFVFVMAYDEARTENLHELLVILFWSTLLSILLTIMLSYTFAENSLKPISKIIQMMKNINSFKSNQRLDEGNKKDEIAQLAITFNEMLTKLELVFKNQKEFVSNASHELRTPLSIMIAETDYILNQTRNTQEYTDQLARLADDLKDMNRIMNSLLELAQINEDNPIQLIPVTIDEIIYNAIQKVKVKYIERKIIYKIDYPENSNELLINGNPGLLVITFKNLIDNACKFSNEDVIIESLINEQTIKVNVIDSGIGIPVDELDIIYSPFKRASNAKYKGGYGIGLSLVKRIMELHQATLSVRSTENLGTKFELTFNRLNSKPF